MEIVITMAGLGTRFRKAGYNVPKYMIEAKGRTLFEWSMESLKGYGDDNTYYFIVRAEDNSADFISKTCDKIGIKRFKVIELDHETDGQATTALLASDCWNKDAELLIYNIDTYVEAYHMNYEEISGDGFIPCFRALGDHWSFVRLDAEGNATEVREKQRISDYCTLGAYYFKSCLLYETLYNEYYEQGKGSVTREAAARAERYVAPLYNYLISKGGIVRISDVDAKYVHVLGTPEELQVFLNE